MATHLTRKSTSAADGHRAVVSGASPRAPDDRPRPLRAFMLPSRVYAAVARVRYPRAVLLLILKLLVVPTLVLIVTLGARRWGPRVGGFLASFPILSGPTLFFFAIEQGPAFVREAARATLMALVAV